MLSIQVEITINNSSSYSRVTPGFLPYKVTFGYKFNISNISNMSNISNINKMKVFGKVSIKRKKTWGNYQLFCFQPYSTNWINKAPSPRLAQTGGAFRRIRKNLPSKKMLVIIHVSLHVNSCLVLIPCINLNLNLLLIDNYNCKWWLECIHLGFTSW